MYLETRQTEKERGIMYKGTHQTGGKQGATNEETMEAIRVATEMRAIPLEQKQHLKTDHG